MKKTVVSLIGLLISISLYAQTYSISGKIIDEVTKQPLQGASVFAENTTLGTATNTDGYFHLLLPNGGYSIVVTYSGYQTETKRVSTGDAGNNTIVVEIKQKEKELQDVVIKASYEVKDGWEKYGDFFLENFIGKTANSQQCNIKNKDAIKFFFYKRKNLLKIMAEEPIEIVNEALGYTIKYSLDSFTHEYITHISTYTGYPLFQEMEPDDEAQRKVWKTNRITAYNGSILHFMRSVYSKKLKEEGFEIQFLIKDKEKERAVLLKNFYSALNYMKDDSNNTVEIKPSQNELAVLYKNEGSSTLYIERNTEASNKFQLSEVNFIPNGSIDIEQNGYYYEQNDISIAGYWAWEKVGDMLPYNYNVKDEISVKKEYVVSSVSTQNENPVIALQQNTVSSPVINSGSLLTSVNWQVDESRGMDGNNMFYYKRGGEENSINFDNDTYKFNTDNTGIYFYNGQEYKFNWNYENDEKTKIKMVILYPSPLIVNLENIVLTATIFKYTRLQKVNGINFMAIETRTSK